MKIKIKKHIGHKIISPLLLFILIIGTTFSTLIPEKVFAANFIDTTFSYQGRLTDSGGIAVSDGSHDFCFSIWTASSGGSKLWPSGTSTPMAATTSSGVFSVVIGSGADDLSTLDVTANSTLYLQVEARILAGGTCQNPTYFEALSPRQRISSSAFSRAALKVINGTFTTPITVNTGSVTLAGNASGSTLTLGAGSFGLIGAASKNLTFNNSLTLSGTDSTIMTFPSTNKTIAANDGSNWTLASQAAGDLLVASSPTAYGRLAKGTSNQVLAMDGAGTNLGWTAAATGDMTLAGIQTISGAKTFNDTKLLMRNVADTFSSYFTNSNTAARIYTLPDRALTIDNITTSTTTNGTGFLKGNGSVISFDNSTYLTSLAGAVLTSQVSPQSIGDTTNRLTKLWATDITATNPIAGSVTGNAGTVTNATLTTSLTNNGGAGTLTWPAAGATLNIPTGGGTLGTNAFNSTAFLTSVGTGVANELTYWSGVNTLGSLATATYPTLAELAFVKGVTSGIQSQLNAKGAGTVTAVSVATANGVSGSSSGGATPALTISLGAITPTSVNSVVLSGSTTPTLAVTGTSSITGSNTGDNAANSNYSADYRASNFTAGTNYIAPYGSITANYHLAAPSGSAGTPVFRALTVLDMPVMTASVGGAVPTPPNNTTTFLRGDGTFAAPTGGAGTVTATGGALTANALVLGAGTTDTKVSTGINSNGVAQLILGVNNTTLGTLKMFGNTSGDVTLQPTAAAGTATVLTMPATTGTIALTSQIPTVGTWGALNYPSWASGTPFVKMTAAGTFALDTNSYVTTAGNAASATKATNLVGGNGTTLLGSIPYQSGTDTTTLLSPNTTAGIKYLSMTGDGTNGAAPVWSTISGGGTVTSVSTAAANNGVTATWSMASPTPALTIGLGAITPTSVNGLTLTAAGTGFSIAGGTTSKTLTMNNTLAFSGTDSTTMTFPSTSATLARTDAANTFTGTQTFSGLIAANAGLTLAGSQTLSGAALSYVDLSAITHGTTAVQGFRLPNAASATPSLPTGGLKGFLAYDTVGNQLIAYNGTAWATVGGGAGGSPGGADTQIQFNNATAFGGSANFTWNNTTNDLFLSGADTGLTLTGITNEPAAPSAGNLHIYSKSIAGRMMPKWKGPSGVDTSFQSNLGFNTIYLWTPATGTTTIGTGFGNTWPAVTGAVTHPTVLNTNIGTSIKVMQAANVVTTPNQILGLTASTATLANVYRGNVANAGGFFFQTRFKTMLVPASTIRLFVGLTSMTTGAAASDAYTGDIAGFDHITTDNITTMSFVTRDNVTTTRATFTVPTIASGNAYDATIYSAPNGTSICYRLVNVVDGAVLVNNCTSTTLPRNTIFMGPQVQMSNGTANTTITTTAIGINKIYLETDN